MRRAAWLLAACLLSGCGGGRDEKALNVYTWSAYFPPEVVADFTKRTGIRVNLDTYDSNEELLAKLQSGVAGYDLCVPSDYMVKVMIAEKLLAPLPKDRITHLANLDGKLLDKKFDPGNVYSIPYFFGTTGIGFDRRVAGEVTSWQAVFDEKLAGRILMLDDMRECFGAALRDAGRSCNETDPARVREAAEKLKAQKRLVKAYNSADFASILAAGDVAVAMGYSGQLAAAVRADPARLGYVVPKEGATVWMDNLAIPAGAAHVDAAVAFIDFVLEPEIGARIVDTVSYGSANAAARPLVRPEILNDAAVFPPDDVLARCELMEDVGETTTLYDRLWAEVKNQ
ncbi:MAG: spermidine/putrescine ABC transporter substrate-binding protein [Acidobacteriota bacterium]